MPRPAAMAADETAVHDYADELLTAKFVSNETYAAAREHLGDAGVAELTCLLGCYVSVTMSLNAHGQSPPSGSMLPPLP